ncbi:MAG: DeoR/GlpR family DNA-binding transcription regulator [Clostridium sp.]|uniref:DeoR/GlpR family DNA-binding transcription regulator n=1 Tax=Clostridium sp. TaxID=1506 RepID=UPI003F2F6B2A
MLTEKRYEIILDLLDENEVIKLSTIAGATNSSESTIRRDLIKLENKGLLKRIHGGAKSLSTKLNNKLNTVNKNLKEQRILGEFCANLIQDGDYVYLDGSEISKHIIKNISLKKVHFFTNSVELVIESAKNNIPIYLLGGTISNDSLMSFGSKTLEEIHGFTFDKSFLFADGINKDKGFMIDHFEKGILYKAICTNTKENYVTISSNDFEVKGHITFSDFQKSTLIMPAHLSNLNFLENIIKVEI